jgi:hypothetical protein
LHKERAGQIDGDNLYRNIRHFAFIEDTQDSCPKIVFERINRTWSVRLFFGTTKGLNSVEADGRAPFP